jgi:hypothetical protein
VDAAAELAWVGGRDATLPLQGELTMPVSGPARHEPKSDVEAFRAIDLGGQVWAHPNPAELYRFLVVRNELLRTIVAESR